jgi:hypothetical protein
MRPRARSPLATALISAGLFVLAASVWRAVRRRFGASRHAVASRPAVAAPNTVQSSSAPASKRTERGDPLAAARGVQAPAKAPRRRRVPALAAALAALLAAAVGVLATGSHSRPAAPAGSAQALQVSAGAPRLPRASVPAHAAPARPRTPAATHRPASAIARRRAPARAGFAHTGATGHGVRPHAKSLTRVTHSHSASPSAGTTRATSTGAAATHRRSAAAHRRHAGKAPAPRTAGRTTAAQAVDARALPVGVWGERGFRETVLTTGVGHPGTYRVAVRLSTAQRRRDTLKVLIGSTWRTVHTGPSGRGIVALAMRIHGRTLTVRALGIHVKPGVQIHVDAATSQHAASSTGASGPTGSSGSSGATGAATPPAPPAPSGASGIAMPAVPAGWHQVLADNFDTPTPFGTTPPGWYGPYSNGTGDTMARGGRGHGIWLSSQSVMVGPGKSGDGFDVPSGVLDIWQHVSNGTPISAVLIPDTPTYNMQSGLTQECVAFAFRVVNPAPGWKIVPMLWNDSNSGTEEIDSPEVEFTPNTITTAMHMANGNQIVPYYGFFSGQLGFSMTTGSYGIDVSKWTEWQTCRTNGHLAVSVNGQLAFSASNGQTFDQWGQSLTVTVPAKSMHWVLQTETSTLANNQPAAGSADHVEFDWVQIVSPNG